MPRHGRSHRSHPSPPPGLAALLLALILGIGSADARAHLSIIRQGAESRGAVEAGDRHGEALAAGDFNGDGIEDLAIGVPEEDVGSVIDAGAVIIVFGNARGLDPAGAMIWTETEITSASPTTNGRFGAALAAADFDDDGYDDLAIGSPGADQQGPSTGIVYLLQGTPGGLAKWYDLTQFDGGAAVEAGDRFGASLAVGNFDGDAQPYPDLAVGSPGENGGRGAVFWFLSNALGPLGASGHFVQSDFGQLDTAGDGFGTSLAAGNFISGPEDDLAVGAPFKNVSGQEDAGKVYQIPGTPVGLQVGGYSVLDPITVGLPQAGSQYGRALAVGRLRDSSSGHESLAVGEPFYDTGGQNLAGRVIVYAGGTSGVITTTEIVLDQNDGGGPLAAGDRFGWFLAAGRFWSDDGWDELAVGAPGDGLGFTSFAGQIDLFFGGPSGPGSHGWAAYNQGTLNQPISGGAELGVAPVFGRFDASGNGHLAVGAPGTGADRGMVHVIAPWRQTYGLSSQHAVAYDCDDQLVFSQKPYDQVLIASTTKIMTVLIGAERMQAGLIDPGQEYVVPQWVATQIGGSQVPLVTGEKVNFYDMLNLCLHLSGNDAAHALADWMAAGPGGGDPALTVAAFVAEMNQRAAQIGMTGTHFNNPNGFEQEVVTGDLGDHYSTPIDMARLSQVAMDNPLFAEIANKTTFGMVRQFPVPGQPGSYFSAGYLINTFFNSIIMNNIQPATGIKGGWTPAAGVTGCFSAENVIGETWVAGTYEAPENTPNYVADAGNLLAIGGNSPGCDVIFQLPSETITYLPSWTNVSAAAGAISGGATEIGWGEVGDLELQVQPWIDADDLGADLEIQYTAEFELEAGSEIPLGVAPFDGHGELALLNTGSRGPVTVEVHRTGLIDPEILVLEPGVPETIPPLEVARRQPQFDLLIMNVTPDGSSAPLSLEIVYPMAVDFGRDLPEEFQARILRPEGVPMRDGLSFLSTGRSSSRDASLAVSVRPAGVRQTSAPGPSLGGPDGTVLQLRPAYPNPIGGSGTVIRFELYQRAPVSVAVYDARGRLVRDLGVEQRLPGAHRLQWDARDGQGRPVGDGVYFYRVEAEGHPARGGKLTVVR